MGELFEGSCPLAVIHYFGRKRDSEVGSFAECALHTHFAAHHLAEFSSDRESQARASILAGRRRIGLGEGIECLVDLLRRHSNAGVVDLKLDPLSTHAALAPDT